VPEGLKNWLFLRIKLIENDEIEINLRKSIALMNGSFLISLIYMVWVINRYFFENDQSILEIKPTITLFMTLSYLLMMMFPVVMILNDSVKANKAVDEGVLSKLELLELNINLLESQSTDEAEKDKFAEFKAAIKEVVDLIGKF